MKPALLAAIALGASVALFSCQRVESINRYMNAVEAVAPYYAPLAEKAGALGFFGEGGYALLRSALAKNPQFLAALKAYYRDPERYFADFHAFTLAYTCYTFKIALGSKSPQEYLTELDRSKRELSAGAAKAGLPAEERQAIAKKVLQLELIEQRIQEYEKAAGTVSPEVMDAVSAHAAELRTLYGRLFSPAR